jgi:amino acid transporter
VVAIGFGAVFYVVCMTAQTLGFGTDAAGVHAFSSSGAPLGDLARSYIGSPMADVLDLVAVLSALGAGLGCASVGTRMLFALGRDGILSRDLAGVAKSTGTPAVALAAEMTISLGLIVGFAVAGTSATNTFFYLATIGILNLLVMYVLTNLGALRYLFLGEVRRARMVEIVFPLVGIGFAVYTLYKNVWPVPPSPFDLFPYIVAAWLALGVAAVFLIPGLSEHIERELRARAGVEEAPPAVVPALQL